MPNRPSHWIPYILGLIVLAGSVFFAIKEADIFEETRAVEGVCLLAALLWMAYIGRDMFARILHIKFDQVTIQPGWLLVLLAMLLRCAAYFSMPPPNQTGFEELQTGEIAYRMIWTPELPVEFRFTNILAALGFSSGTGINLQALRLPFQIAGIISLILLVYCLRLLKVGWLPTILITFISATLPFLVIAAGTADEIFAGMFFALFLLTCFIKAITSAENQPFWYAAAGFFAGILMYEYTSYRVYILLGLGWLLWRCFTKRKSEQDTPLSNRWCNLFSYLFPLILVALPTIIFIIRNPASSIFLDAFRRHGEERPTLFSTQFLFNAKQLMQGLTGWPSVASLYLTSHNVPVILAVVGWLFGISFIYCLFISSRGFLRMLAISVGGLVLGAALLANDPNFSRMAPAIPLLLIMSGYFLESIYSKIKAWLLQAQTNEGSSFPQTHNINATSPDLRKPEPGLEKSPAEKKVLPRLFNHISIDARKIGKTMRRSSAILVFILLTVAISIANLDSLRRMRIDPLVINEYVNDDYSICAAIGNMSTPGQQVYLYSPDKILHCSDNRNEGWYFNGNRIVLHNILDEFHSPAALAPGDLVVEGVRNRSLSNDEISSFVHLAINTGSLDSLQSSKDMAGKLNTISFCYQCTNSAP